jgi:hypothetical protein
MKKLTLILTVLALVLLGACGGDSTEMDIGLDGNWIAQNGATLLINGMGYTLTTATGSVETGTLAAAGGKITFSRIGHSPETMDYKYKFPELQIGDIIYYYDSPSEPKNIVGTWVSYEGFSPALIFFQGKPVKDENKRDTPAREGEFIWYGYFKGKYMISNRNLPNNSRLVLTTSHIHGSNLAGLISSDDSLALELQELFDPSIVEIPRTQPGIEDWWFTIDEIRNYFDAAAERTTDIRLKTGIYALLERFLWYYIFEGTFAYTVEFETEVPNEFASKKPGVPNKLTMTDDQGDVDRFFLWDEEEFERIMGEM